MSQSSLVSTNVEDSVAPLSASKRSRKKATKKAALNGAAKAVAEAAPSFGDFGPVPLQVLTEAFVELTVSPSNEESKSDMNEPVGVATAVAFPESKPKKRVRKAKAKATTEVDAKAVSDEAPPTAANDVEETVKKDTPVVKKGASKAKRENEKPKEDSRRNKAAKGEKSGEEPVEEPVVFGPVFEKPNDIYEYACNWVHRLGPSNRVAIDHLVGCGVRVKAHETDAHRLHPVSRIFRDECVIEMLKQEGRNLTNLSVLDYYGATRNQKFNPGKYGNGGHVTWYNAPKIAIAGDQARVTNREDYESMSAEVALIQDVYFDGREPMNADALKRIIDGVKNAVVYVMFRPFRGEAGSDRPYGPDNFVEGVWYREGGLVYFSPEEGGVCYPNHPDLNWLLQRHHEGLDIQDVRTCGPYHFVKVRKSLYDALPLGIELKPEGLIEKFQEDSSMWTECKEYLMEKKSYLYDSICPEIVRPYMYSYMRVRFLVHRGIRDDLTNIGIRPPTGYLADTAIIRVKVAMDKDPMMKAIKNRFASVYARIVEGTFVAVMYHDRTERAKRLYTYRSMHSEGEHILEAVRSPGVATWTKPATFPWWLVAVAVGLYVKKRFVANLSGKLVKGLLAAFIRLLKPAPASLSYALREKSWLLSNVLAEEAIRASHPVAGVVLGLVEYGIRLYKHGVFRGDVPPLVLHLGLSYLMWRRKWSWASCVFIHAAYNTWVLEAPKVLAKMVWTQFAKTHSEGRLMEINGSFQIPIPAGSELIPIQTRVNEWTDVIRGKIAIRVNGQEFSPTEALQALDGEVYTKNTMFPILITHRILWEPARTQKNLLLGLLCRVHKVPKYHASSEAFRAKNWREAYRVLEKTGVLNDEVFINTSLEEAAKAMGPKGARLIKASERENAEGSNRYSKTMSLKWNETIPAGKEIGKTVDNPTGTLSIKPRVITVLDPTSHAHTTVTSRELAQAAKKRIFHRELLVLENGMRVWLVYASGLAQEELDELGNWVESVDDVVVVASGDDTFFKFGRYSEYFGMTHAEGDFGMADQSQDKACFENYQFKVMRKLRVSEENVDLLRSQCSDKYTVRKQNLEVDGDGEFQLPTGTTYTSFCNTNTALGSALYFFSKCDLSKVPPPVAETFGELGLDIKFIPCASFSEVTFLKGWWIRERDSCVWHWMPLPSQVIKIGKELVDPELSTKVTRRGRTVRYCAEDAVRIVAHSIYLGHANIEETYPVLGPFVQALKRCSMAPKGNVVTVGSEKHNRVEFGKFPKLCDHMLLSNMEARYGITKTDLDRVHGILESVDTLPALVCDPVFDMLCDTDYGADETAGVPASLWDAVMGGGSIKPTTYQSVMPKRSKKKAMKKTQVVVERVTEKKRKRRNRRKNTKKKSVAAGLTPDGAAFLKCVTAPCDFVTGAINFEGIPDEYDGRVIVDSVTSVSSLPTYVAGQDLYFIQPPIPGVAYMWGQVSGGTTGLSDINWNPVWYSDVRSLFPTDTEMTIVVDKFRVASNAIEFVNTSNDMLWAGSIEGFKLDLGLGRIREDVIGVGATDLNLDVPIITGWDGLYTTQPGYVEAIRDGIYMTAFNQQADYPFAPVDLEFSLRQIFLNAQNASADTMNGHVFCTIIDPNYFVGFGTLETNVVRIPSIAAGQSMRIRTWTCVEYTVPSTSLLWNYSHLSPPADPAALELLKAFHHQFPMAVKSAQNATFWENVRKWLTRVTRVAGYLPGPVGQMSRLVDTMARTGDLGFSLD